jgi:bacterioferritin
MTQTTQPKRPAAVPVVTELLTIAYLMELETVANYLAASMNLDGIRAQESRTRRGDRRPGGARPCAPACGPAEPAWCRRARLPRLIAKQDSLQPTGDSTDVEVVIRGVLEAEEAHRRLFEGFLREYEAESR